MPIYRPSELKGFLREMSASPKKGLSQCFLVDGNVIRKVVKSAEITAGDVVVEIGPGPGAITEELLAAGAALTAYETDKQLGAALSRLGHLDVRVEDFLRAELDTKRSGQKLVSNLPFHLTAPILEKVIPLYSTFSTLTLIMQHEVAERITAPVGSKEYGSLSVFVNFFTTPRYLFKIKRTSFYPSPKVDSACIQLTLKPPPTVDCIERFFTMTRTAFQQKRKMLRASLKSIYSPASVENALISLGLPATARPQELSVGNFCALLPLLTDREEGHEEKDA